MSNIGFFIEMLDSCDFDVFGVICKELGCQWDEIELIVLENIVLKVVFEVQGLVLINKYVEGYLGKCYYGGC